MLEGIRTARPVDPFQTDYAISFRAANTVGAVADELFPTVPVKGDTGTYLVWSSGNVFRNRSTFWAKGAPTPEMRIRATSATFACKKYGLRTSIDDDDRDNNLSGAALDEEATAALTKTLMLDREVRVQAAVAALTADLDITTPANRQWDESAATPKADIDGGNEGLQKAIGMPPTLLVMGRSVYKSLRNDAAIAGSAAAQLQAAIQYVLPVTNGNINTDLIAQWLDVPRVVVAQMVYDAAIETGTVDVGNVTGTYIWPDTIIMARIEPNSTTNTLSFAKTFTSDEMHMTPRWRTEEVEAEWFRIKMKVDESITTRKAAWLIKDVLNAV